MAPKNEQYLIPFGIDAGGFFKGIQDMDKATDTLQSTVNEAGKSMKNSLTEPGKAADDLKAKLKGSTDAAIVLRATAKELGKDLSTALSAKGNAKQVEELVSRYQSQLFKLQKSSKINLDVVFNEATIKEIANAAGGASQELEFLNQALAAAKVNLAGLDTNSEEWQNLNQQIQLSEGLMEGLANAEKLAETGSKSLKAQLRELKAELAAMEMEGKAGTAEFVQMSIKAGELEDQIGDVAARVRVLASDTKYLDAGVQAITALAGGFAIAQGAAALFGEENEAVNEALKKVTAAMAILQGIQAVANALNKDSALNVLLFSRAQAAQVVTTTALTGATVAETTATTAATAATASFTATLLANPFIAIAALIIGIVSAIIGYISAADDAAIATKNFNDALEANAVLLKLDESQLKRRTDLLVAQAKAQGKGEAEIARIQEEGLKRKLALYQRDEEETRKAYNQALALGEDFKGNFKEVSDKLLESQEKVKDVQNEIEVKKFDDQAAANKRSEDQAKKALESSKKNAEAQQKILEQIVSFRKILQDTELGLMKEGFEKDRKQAQIRAEQQIADINKEKALSTEAAQLKSQAIAAINKQLAADLNKIDVEEKQTRFELELSYTNQIIALRKDGLQKELSQIDAEKAAKEESIKREFKDQTVLREDLLEALEEEVARKRKEVTDKFNLQRLEQQEQQEILALEFMAGYALKPAEIEEQKQREILKVQLKYAEIRLKQLIDSGAKETDIAVLQAKNTVSQIKAEIDNVGRDRPFTLFSLLGLDSELTDREQKQISDSSKAIMSGVKELTDYLVAQNQREIDMRNENISRIDEELDVLRDQLDKEKEYKDQGFAYNTMVTEAEIAEKEKQKEEEIRIRNEAFEEQKRIQKLQLAVDAAIQLSSLATAAANILKGYSTLPFVGQVLGAVAVGAMIAGFIASKAKMFEAINSQTPDKFEDGGWIDGELHSNGGKKYYAADGSVKELEKGEFVTKRIQAAKFAPILDAINSDRLSGMSADAIRDLLAGTGVRLSDEVESGVSEARYNDFARAQINFTNNQSPQLDSIDSNMAILVKMQRDKVEVWEEDGFIFRKKGSRTTKIKK